MDSASQKYKLSEEIESHLPDGMIGKYQAFHKKIPWTDRGFIIETSYAAEYKIKQDMQYQIENIHTLIAAKHTPPDYLPGSDDILLSHCDCISAGSLTNALCKQNLWPLSSAIRQLSIAMFCKKLEVCDVGLPNRIAKPKKCAKCS